MTNMLILGGLAWGWLTLLIAPSVCGGLGLPRVSKAEMEDHTCSSVRVIFMSAFASFFLYRCRGDNCVLHGFCTVPQKIKGVGCNRLDSGPDGTQHAQNRTRTKSPFVAATTGVLALKSCRCRTIASTTYGVTHTRRQQTGQQEQTSINCPACV